MKLPAPILALVIAAVTSTANAGLIADRTSFEDAISNGIVDDYSSPGYAFLQDDDAMSAVLNQTIYRTTGFTNQNIVSSSDFYCAGCNGSFVLDFTSTSIGTASGVFGVGFEYFNLDGIYSVFATFGDGSSANFALADISNFTFSGFFGLTSDLGISSLALGLENGATTIDGSLGIDNLTIGCNPGQRTCTGTVDVPAPATLVLLGLGLAGVGYTTRPR